MTDSQSLINDVIDFYGTYLSCSPGQLDLLALWTFHTHCFEDAPFSPALNIHSRHKQSGKTRCLELLDALCHRTSFHTSPSPALVVRQTQGFNNDNPFKGTLLLDDCRFSTVLQGVLSAGFRWYGTQIARDKNEHGQWEFQRHPTFFPKAFAGNRRLPDCLRDISIPIALEPKPPDSPCYRFKIGNEMLHNLTFTLRNKLYQWGLEHAPRLIDIPAYEPSLFPPELSSRQQDCAEPLLQIAYLIGGEWPQRACQALVDAFALAAFEDFHSSKQILADIHEAFAAHGNPEWISTADLQEFLPTLDDRPWDEWSKGKPITSKDVGGLLDPFGIKSKNHRTTDDQDQAAKNKVVKDKVVKGYNLKAFEKAWHKYLPLQKTCGTEACPRGECRRACPEVRAEGTPGCGEDSQGSHASVAANPQNPECGTAAPGCGEGSLPSAGSPVAANSQNSSELHPTLRCQPKEASSQKLVAPSPVAANSQNPECGTEAPGCGEDIQGSHAPAAANSRNSAKPDPVPKQPVRWTVTVAGQQHSAEAAELQKRRYDDPLLESCMRDIEKTLNQ